MNTKLTPLRTFAPLSAGLAASVALSLPAAAEDLGFYAKVDVGPAFTQNTDLKAFPEVAGSHRVTFDPGARINAGFGYKFLEWLAAEVDTGIAVNSIDSIRGASRADANVANVPFLANLVLEIPTGSRFVPFLGGGVGFSSTVLNVDEITIDGVTVFDGSDADVVLAYQGFAGVRYEIDRHWSVSLAYHYLGTQDASWETHSIFLGEPSHNIRLGSLNTHAVTAGFNFRF